MWRDTACNEMSNGAASSETSKSSASRRSRIERRTGSASAAKTPSSAASCVSSGRTHSTIFIGRAGMETR